MAHESSAAPLAPPAPAPRPVGIGVGDTPADVPVDVPVDVFGGAVPWVFDSSGADLDLRDRAAALDLHRTASRLPGSFGSRDASMLDVALVAQGECASVRLVDGGLIRFVRGGSGWVCTAGPLYALIEHPDGWSLSTWRHTVVDLDRAGVLRSWRTEAGSVGIVRDSHGQVVTVEERTCGHRLHIDWTDGLVAQLTTDDGQSASYTYRSGRLVRVTYRRAW